MLVQDTKTAGSYRRLFIINGGLYVCIKRAGYMIPGVFVYLVLWRVGGVC